MTIRLQAGKTYTSKMGKVFGPLKEDPETGVFYITDEFVRDKTPYWFKNGVYKYLGDYDLVSEYVDKSKFLEEGKTYSFNSGTKYAATRIAKCLLTTKKQAVMLVYRNGIVNTEDFYVAPFLIENADGKFFPLPPTGTKPQEDF